MSFAFLQLPASNKYSLPGQILEARLKLHSRLIPMGCNLWINSRHFNQTPLKLDCNALKHTSTHKDGLIINETFFDFFTSSRQILFTDSDFQKSVKITFWIDYSLKLQYVNRLKMLGSSLEIGSIVITKREIPY